MRSKNDITKAQLLKELSAFASPSTRTGLTIFFLNYIVFWVSVLGVLFAPAMWMKAFFSFMVGFRLTAFYTLAHDASHSSFVNGKHLNWVIALLFGVPATHNYRMWTYDHNTVHHPFTNRDHFDYYTPLSKSEYDLLPAHKRWMERIYRTPLLIGWLLYFLIHWLPTRVYPNPRTPRAHRLAAQKYAMLLLGYHGAFVAFLAYSPNFAPVTATQAILLAWALPLLMLMFMTSASLYLMHTHPDIPWFRGDELKHKRHSPEICSTVLVMPRWLSKLVNNVYCHAAHHAHSGIPTYKLYDAQQRMNELVGHRLVLEPLSMFSIIGTLRKCKLYDYENHQWLDFGGKPTAHRIDLKAKGL